MDDYSLDTTAQTIPWMLYGAYAVVALLSLVALIAALVWLKRRLTRPELYGMTREQVMERWKGIRQTSTQGIMGAKLAVMEADTLLDSALKSIMMPGETLGERLKVACYKYQKLRNVWWAHKLRNQLVHESSFQLSQRQSQQALDEYERALKTLNLM